MPKLLFYAGTAFCLFLTLASAGEVAGELRNGLFGFVALPESSRAPWAILTAFFAGLAVAALFLRTAALLAARNLFAAFVAVLSVTGALATLAALLLVQYRVTAAAGANLGDVHFAVLAILFFSIAVHCIRHRHLFLEISNLRELLDSRVDPGNRPGRIGGVAFDS